MQDHQENQSEDTNYQYQDERNDITTEFINVKSVIKEYYLKSTLIYLTNYRK